MISLGSGNFLKPDLGGPPVIVADLDGFVGGDFSQDIRAGAEGQALGNIKKLKGGGVCNRFPDVLGNNPGAIAANLTRKILQLQSVRWASSG